MADIKKLRQQYPDYDDLSDTEFADKYHAKYYSDIPKQEFYSKLGLTGEQRTPEQPNKKMQDDWTNLPRALGAGLLEGGRNILNIPNQLKKATGNHLFKHAEEFPPQNFRETVGLNGEPTIPEQITESVGQFLPAIAAPELSLGKAGALIEKIPKYGKLLKSIAGQAVLPSLYSATQSEEHPIKEAGETAALSAPFTALTKSLETRNPLLRTLGRLGLGTALGGTGYLGAKALGLPASVQIGAAAGGAGFGLKSGVSPEIAELRAIKKGIEGTGYKEKLEAAKRLGLKYLTPAEASGNPFLGSRQGNIGKSETGAPAIVERGNERLATERSAIKNLYETIHKEEANPEIEALYKKSYEQKFPLDQLREMQNNDIYKAAKKMVEKRPAYRESLKEVPENSIAYLDHVKKSMDDMIKTARNSGATEEARLITGTKNKLIDQMDSISPEYKQARELSQRKIVRSKLEKKLNDYDVRGSNLFNKVLKNDKSYDELHMSLKNVPEAQKQLKDMRLIFRDLLNPPTVKTARSYSTTGVNQNRNIKTEYVQQIKELLSGHKNDKSMVDLITNPKWAYELHRVAKLTNKEKATKATLGLLRRSITPINAEPKKPLELLLTKAGGQ